MNLVLEKINRQGREGRKEKPLYQPQGRSKARQVK
jgi:hypothetical protein